MAWHNRKVQQELGAAERKWHESREANDLSDHHYLSFLPVTAAKMVFYQEKVV